MSIVICVFVDPKPVVYSSFVTEFYHHINVAMDAEAILFIHDLITSYVKEKDKGTQNHTDVFACLPKTLPREESCFKQIFFFQ